MLDPHQALQGKTELFQKKVTKKGPKTGSDWIIPTPRFRSFFMNFRDSRISKLKCHERENGVKPAHMPPMKITQICDVRTYTQTDTSSWKPGVAEKEAPSAQ